MFETPQRSHQTATPVDKARRALDFSTDAQEVEQILDWFKRPAGEKNPVPCVHKLVPSIYKHLIQLECFHPLGGTTGLGASNSHSSGNSRPIKGEREGEGEGEGEGDGEREGEREGKREGGSETSKGKLYNNTIYSF